MSGNHEASHYENFLHSPVSCSLLDPDITSALCSSLNVNNHVSCLHETMHTFIKVLEHITFLSKI